MEGPSVETVGRDEIFKISCRNFCENFTVHFFFVETRYGVLLQRIIEQLRVSVTLIHNEACSAPKLFGLRVFHETYKDLAGIRHQTLMKSAVHHIYF
jgi:hypothetical protein